MNDRNIDIEAARWVADQAEDTARMEMFAYTMCLLVIGGFWGGVYLVVRAVRG
jgi:hypothetical protein